LQLILAPQAGIASLTTKPLYLKINPQALISVNHPTSEQHSTFVTQCVAENTEYLYISHETFSLVVTFSIIALMGIEINNLNLLVS